eukprot:m.244353 g.244353  ORF g.244353 m.244353 type:complete len:223 (-) comp22559_c3_seq2:123-791(-)
MCPLAACSSCLRKCAIVFLCKGCVWTTTTFGNCLPASLNFNNSTICTFRQVAFTLTKIPLFFFFSLLSCQKGKTSILCAFLQHNAIQILPGGVAFLKQLYNFNAHNNPLLRSYVELGALSQPQPVGKLSLRELCLRQFVAEGRDVSLLPDELQELVGAGQVCMECGLAVFAHYVQIADFHVVATFHRVPVLHTFCSLQHLQQFQTKPHPHPPPPRLRWLHTS